MRDKPYANSDTTYCTNETCLDKCWRHISNWKFNENEDYWLMEYCAEERERIMKLLNVKK